VPEPRMHFQLVGFKDLGSLPGTTLPGFPIALPSSPSTTPGFRATVNPRTAFAGLNTGIALFVATRFNPPVSSCLSSFDTAIFAVNAANGTAVYDMNSGTAGLETFKVFQGVKAVGD